MFFEKFVEDKLEHWHGGPRVDGKSLISEEKILASLLAAIFEICFLWLKTGRFF